MFTQQGSHTHIHAHANKHICTHVWRETKKERETTCLHTYWESKRENTYERRDYTPASLNTITPGETTSRADESDWRMSLTGWWRSLGREGLEVVESEMGGYRLNGDRWMYHIGPRQECGASASYSDLKNNEYSVRERERGWGREVLRECTLQSQCFMQQFGLGALSSRALWQWWWALQFLLSMNQQLTAQTHPPVSGLNQKPFSFRDLHYASQTTDRNLAHDCMGWKKSLRYTRDVLLL